MADSPNDLRCKAFKILSHLINAMLLNGRENIQFKGCSLWSSLPNVLKDSDTLQEFKRRIKQWDGICCNCRLCKVFIKDLGVLV